MKKILITAGPIPAKLDSVKIITNKFKGGLAMKTATMLAQDENFDVEIVAWEGTDLHLDQHVGRNIELTKVKDISDYEKVVLEKKADAYILAAAVSNLMPSEPWEGKFPSHLYKVGDQFPVVFEIAPRIIDQIKQRYPRSTLIGYKLFDGPDETLIQAGKKTLFESKANVVFCNHPRTAKEKKIAVMLDDAQIPMSFDEHVDFIKRIINLEYYCTNSRPNAPVTDPYLGQFVQLYKKLDEFGVFKHDPVSGLAFGTFAIRVDKTQLDNPLFVTTTRGKRMQPSLLPYPALVLSVDLDKRIVYTHNQVKATMNAPLLWRIFKDNHDINYIVHGHKKINGFPTYPYVIPGTTEEDALPIDSPVFNVENHGYYAVFSKLDDFLRWCRYVGGKLQ